MNKNELQFFLENKNIQAGIFLRYIILERQIFWMSNMKKLCAKRISWKAALGVWLALMRSALFAGIICNYCAFVLGQACLQL